MSAPEAARADTPDAARASAPEAAPVGMPGPARAGMPGTVRVAAIDCGTNSVRLLVADVDGQRGSVTDVVRRMEIVRLGQGVDATGRLAPEALRRTLDALRGYARIIEQTSAAAVRMVATSATRDAANAGEFVAGVGEVLGVLPEVLSGEEEGNLSFTGATAELAGRLPGPFLVVDIGGGSTEFVLGDAGRQATSVSVNVGCVRMTERHLHGDPPAGAEVSAARADIGAALAEVASRIPVDEAASLIGLAGSVTTVAALALGLPGYDAARIHHAHISAGQVHEVTAALLRQPRAGRAALAVMHPGRVDVIGGGAMVLDQIMTEFGFAEVIVSEHDILDGIALSLGGVPAQARAVAGG